MSPVQETQRKTESNQLPFLSKAQSEQHWLKLLREDTAVTLWFVGENTATAINQTLIFSQETITNQCLLPQQTMKTESKKFLQQQSIIRTGRKAVLLKGLFVSSQN